MAHLLLSLKYLWHPKHLYSSLLFSLSQLCWIGSSTITGLEVGSTLSVKSLSSLLDNERITFPVTATAPATNIPPTINLANTSP